MTVAEGRGAKPAWVEGNPRALICYDGRKTEHFTALTLAEKVAIGACWAGCWLDFYFGIRESGEFLAAGLELRRSRTDTANDYTLDDHIIDWAFDLDICWRRND